VIKKVIPWVVMTVLFVGSVCGLIFIHWDGAKKSNLATSQVDANLAMNIGFSFLHYVNQSDQFKSRGVFALGVEGCKVEKKITCRYILNAQGHVVCMDVRFNRDRTILGSVTRPNATCGLPA